MKIHCEVAEETANQKKKKPPPPPPKKKKKNEKIMVFGDAVLKGGTLFVVGLFFCPVQS